MSVADIRSFPVTLQFAEQIPTLLVRSPLHLSISRGGLLLHTIMLTMHSYYATIDTAQGSASAGMIGRVFCHPIDTVKARLQASTAATGQSMASHMQLRNLTCA